MSRGDIYPNLSPYAQRGVDALRSATPRDSGATADAWTYEITKDTIWWSNSNVVSGFNVAIGLRYGHGTGQGGWVQGYNFIEPALRPIFDEIANQVWMEVKKA